MVNITGIEIGIGKCISVFSIIFNIALSRLVANPQVLFALPVAVIAPKSWLIVKPSGRCLFNVLRWNCSVCF